MARAVKRKSASFRDTSRTLVRRGARAGDDAARAVASHARGPLLATELATFAPAGAPGAAGGSSPPAAAAGLGGLGGGGEPVVSNVVGLLVAGRPVQTAFAALSPTRLVASVPNPADVRELSLFLLPGFALPPGSALVIYASTNPTAGAWTVLGGLTADRPSATFVTRWAANRDVAAAPAVAVGVSVEPAAAAADAMAAAAEAAAGERLGVAQLVARDVSNFLGSFATVVPSLGERIVVPASALTAWLAKFEEKLRLRGL